MKKILVALTLAAFAMFTGCSTEETTVVCGRDWNPGAQVVADTTSEFDLADQMVVQFRYGKGFDFSKLTVAIYEGTAANKGKEVWSRESNVTDKMSVYTLQGKSSHGGMMLAREWCKTRKPGQFVVEFSTEGRVLATKEITLVKSR